MQHHSGDDIGVFLAVCDAGSFVAASRRLHLSASAVAKAIGRLEYRLQTRLFLRTTRSLSLTQEGLGYREACQSAREQIERAEMVLRNFRDEPVGTVRISLPPLLGTRIVAPALYELGRSWPSLHYEISTSTTRSDLFEGEVDLAVRIGALPDLSGLIARRLGEQRIVLCGSSAYFSNRPRPMCIGDLKDHDVIGMVRNGKPAPWQFKQANGEWVMWTPHSRLLLDGSLLTLFAIAEGQGIGLVPRWLVEEDIAQGRIISILDDIVAGHLDVHVIWPASPVLLPRLRVTIDAIQKATSARLA